MTEIQVDGSGKDGAMAFWQPGPTTVQVLTDALGGANMMPLFPKDDRRQWALKEIMSDFCSNPTLSLKQRGNPIKISPLELNVKGVEAVRQIKGNSRNQHDFLMSITLDSHDNVRVAEMSSHHFPTLIGNVSKVEALLTRSFQQKMLIMPTSWVSSCLNRVLGHLNGTPCKDGVWFLPGNYVPFFEDLARKIMAGSDRLVITTLKFPLRPTESSYRMVLESIRREAADVTTAMNEALAELAGSELRSDGIATRLRVLSELKTKVKLYEELLGVTMADVHKAVDDSVQAVNTHNVLASCA